MVETEQETFYRWAWGMVSEILPLDLPMAGSAAVHAQGLVACSVLLLQCAEPRGPRSCSSWPNHRGVWEQLQPTSAPLEAQDTGGLAVLGPEVLLFLCLLPPTKAGLPTWPTPSFPGDHGFSAQGGLSGMTISAYIYC